MAPIPAFLRAPHRSLASLLFRVDEARRTFERRRSRRWISSRLERRYLVSEDALVASLNDLRADRRHRR